MDLKTYYRAAQVVLYSLSPTKDDDAKRKRLIRNFKRFIQRFRELKGCIFESYGSYASELYTKYGDVDLSVRHDDHKDILSLLQMCIKQSGDYSSVTYRKDARVPVLNFKYEDVLFDISVHTESGKISALLFSRLKDMDICFREVVLLAKGWATCHNIHGASRGGFSSYVLYVMVIFHFQTTTPPILPPLNELCTCDVMLKLKRDDENWKKDFASNVSRFKESRGLDEKNAWDIYKVFYDFIKKFKYIRRKAKHSYMSVKRGEWVARREWVAATPGLMQQPLWIEEPFGEPENIARSIKDVKRIGRAFKATDKAIKTGNMDDILQILGSEDLLKVIDSTNWDAIPMHYTLEVGPNVVASTDKISLSSSAAIIPQSSAKVSIPAKTEGTCANGMSSSSSHGDVLGLGSYASDEDEDKEGSSHGDLLGLGCYASDEDDGKVPDMTGMDKECLKADESSKIHDEKHIKWEKKDDENDSKEKLKERDSEKRFKKNEINDDKKKRGRYRRSNDKEDDRVPRSPLKYSQRKHSKYSSLETTSYYRF